MADKAQLNQFFSYDDQNYNFDIDQIFNDFIKEIDNVRSFATFNEDNSKAFLKALDPDTLNVKEYNLNIENAYQESRCHAFFRLIGLPVLAADDTFYSPGHDNIKEEGRSITLQNKIKISLNPIINFDKLTGFRENYIQSVLKVFSKPTSIDAGCLAISSGSSGEQGSPNIRIFNAPFDINSDYLDMSPENQSYNIKTTTLVGTQILLLSEFEDELGNKPQISQNKKHIIKPLIVNGKIDFICNPSTRRICVPFVYDKSNAMVSTNVYAKRPLIEKIIRNKLSSISDKDESSFEKIVKSYIQNFSDIKDVSIFEKINSIDYDYSDRFKFANSLKMIKEMIKKLVESTDVIKTSQGKYCWIPQTTITGTEQGCSVKPIYFPKNASGVNLLTELDKNILFMAAKGLLNQNSSANNSAQKDDPEDFALNNFENSFDKETSSSMGDAAANSLDKISSTRKSILQKANDAARTVEIIMGEFSGLGLCDIFAITGALSILPLKDLLGLIDDDAFTRMNKILQINLSSLDRSNVKDALKTLTDIVKDFYNIMDQIYVNYLNDNSNFSND